MKGERLILAALLIFALIAVPLAFYTVGYFALGERINWSSRAVGYAEEVPFDLDYIERSYSRPGLATAYRPAARVEGWLRGVPVEVTYSEQPPPAMQGTSPGAVERMSVEIGEP